MCKRFVTTIAACVAGIVSLFGVLSFSACEKQGEQVNEEQWGESIEQTLIATNYTVNVTGEATQNFISVTTQNNEKYTLSGKALITENGCYIETKGTESDNSNVFLQAYFVIEETQIWMVVNSTYVNKWQASSSNRELYDEYINENGGLTFLGAKYSLEKGGEEKPLKELFSEFTYANGKYSATLYSETTYISKENLSLKVSKGYIIEMDREASGELWGTTIEMKGNYKFSDFGTTKLNIPQEVLDAIEAAKAKQ